MIGNALPPTFIQFHAASLLQHFNENAWLSAIIYLDD
jgi:hypothetical protein